MRITEAAQRLGTSPRMLRYRDMLGLLPPVRPVPGPGARGAGPAHGAGAQARGAGAGTSAAGTGAGGADTGAREAGGEARGADTAARGAGAAARGAEVGARGAAGRSRRHRQFREDDLAAVAHALRIERRYDISPAALAFGLRVLTDAS